MNESARTGAEAIEGRTVDVPGRPHGGAQEVEQKTRAVIKIINRCLPEEPLTSENPEYGFYGTVSRMLNEDETPEADCDAHEIGETRHAPSSRRAEVHARPVSTSTATPAGTARGTCTTSCGTRIRQEGSAGSVEEAVASTLPWQGKRR